MEIPIKVSGNIISELSEKIPSNIIALNELIKNSYDAGSPYVKISLDTKNLFLSIEDSGEGMNEEDIQTLFHLSKSTKKYGYFNDKYKRYVQGAKGLGFLSVFKFGRYVQWYTNKDKGFKFHVDFDEILSVGNLLDHKLNIVEDSSIEKGTRIVIRLNEEATVDLLDYFGKEENYNKIIYSFTDDEFLIQLDIDGKKYSNDKKIDINNYYKERQLFFVEYDSDLNNIRYYHNNIKIYEVNFNHRPNCKIKVKLSIYDLGKNYPELNNIGKKDFNKLFINPSNELTPLIYINDNLFNNYAIFDPGINKDRRSADVLNQMIGYVNIYSDNKNLVFNSDRTNLAQNVFTSRMIEFLSELNKTIQIEGGKFKKNLLDLSFFDKNLVLKDNSIRSDEVDLSKEHLLRNLINSDFYFRDNVEIKVEKDFIEFKLFDKSRRIKIEKVKNEIFLPEIKLKKEVDKIFIPSDPIDLRTYILSSRNSLGQDITQEINILQDSTLNTNKILQSIVDEKTIKIEYYYEDLNKIRIHKKLMLYFIEPKMFVSGTESANQLLSITTSSEYSINMGNVLNKLINQINKLTASSSDYTELIACSLRSLFEISIEALNTSNKNDVITYVKDNNPENIRRIINFIKMRDAGSRISNRLVEIENSTKITYKTLDNMLDVTDYLRAYKKSNLGPHLSNAYLTDKDIEFIAQKAIYFVVLVNEIINNPKIN